MVLRYVERNPVRANLVHSAGQWRWSSHRETSGAMPVHLVSRSPIDLPSDWVRYVDEAQSEAEVGAIRKSLRRQAPFGNRSWVSNLASALGLETTLHPLGRPRRMLEDVKK